MIFKKTEKGDGKLSDKIKGGFLRAISFLKKSRALTPLVISVLIFNMIVVASVAWFTINRKTDADEMGMALAVDDTAAEYRAYMYDLVSGKGINQLPDGGGELTITNIDLNQYDTIFSMQNKYTPAFAQIVIVRNKSMPLNGTVYLTITRNDLEAHVGELEQFSSSVIRFTAFIDTTKGDLEITDPDLLYDYINSDTRFNTVENDYKGKALSNSKTFVTVVGEGEGHTHEKVESITVAVDYTDEYWYKNEDGHDALNVYLYLTYDVQLIQCFMDEHTGGEISFDDNLYFFENDMKKISVSYEK